MLWLDSSRVMVRAPRCVGMDSTSENLPGASSCATVSVPSPHEANANPVPGSNRLASTPVPMGTVPTTFPVLPSTNAIILLWQPTTNRSYLASIANPEGESQGASGHVFVSVTDLESIS